MSRVEVTERLRAMATVALDSGHWADALHASKSAVRHAYGSADPLDASDAQRVKLVAEQLEAHARLLWEIGDREPAVSNADLAAGLLEMIDRPTHPELDAFRARMLLAGGEAHRARHLALRAAGRLTLGEQASAMTTHAAILRRLDHGAASVKAARDALRAFRDADETDHPDYAHAALTLCWNLLTTGDRREVKQLAQEVRRRCGQAARPREHALATYLTAAAGRSSLEQLMLLELADSLLAVSRVPEDWELAEARELAAGLRRTAAEQERDRQLRTYAQAAILQADGRFQAAADLYRLLPPSCLGGHELAMTLIGTGTRPAAMEAMDLLEQLPPSPVREAELGAALLVVISLAQHEDLREAATRSARLIDRCAGSEAAAMRLVHVAVLDLATSLRPQTERTALLTQTVELRRSLLDGARPSSRVELAEALTALGRALVRGDGSMTDAARALTEAYGTLGGLDHPLRAQLREQLLMIKDTRPEIAQTLDLERRLG